MLQWSLETSKTRKYYDYCGEDKDLPPIQLPIIPHAQPLASIEKIPHCMLPLARQKIIRNGRVSGTWILWLCLTRTHANCYTLHFHQRNNLEPTSVWTSVGLDNTWTEIRKEKWLDKTAYGELNLPQLIFFEGIQVRHCLFFLVCYHEISSPVGPFHTSICYIPWGVNLL